MLVFYTFWGRLIYSVPLRRGACWGPTYPTGNNENVKQGHLFSAIISAVCLQNKNQTSFLLL